MLRRYIKYGLVGATGLITANTAVKLHKNNYDINSLVVVRSGRSILTTFEIGMLYKKKLYARNLDKKSEEYIQLRSEVHKMAAEKLLELCIANKGVFVKVGQHIGAMDHVLPSEYVETMRILHKEAPVTPIDMVLDVIKKDLKIDPSEIFDSFEPVPLGAASLAQAHKATLKDGTTVAVKVQHPFIKNNIDADIKIMEFLVMMMSRYFPDFKMEWLVKLTKRNVICELDFINEGENAEKLASLFKNYKWLKIPKIFWEYTSKRVLCMEYIEGGQVNNIDYINKHNIDRYDLSKKLGDLYSHMIFVHGFIHGDPHSGNIVLKKEPEDKEVTVYLLDHGLYGTLTDEFRFNYSQLWMSIIKKDFEKMKHYVTTMGIDENLYFLFACMVTGRPWNSIKAGISNYRPSNQEKDEFQKSVPGLISSVSYCLETVDPQILIVLKTNDLIRSIEFMLGTHDKMCGFTVMTKCCLETIKDGYVRNSKSTLDKVYVKFKHIYTMVAFYLYTWMAELRLKLLL